MKVLIQFIVCPQPGRERRWLHLFCAASVIRSSEWSPVIQGNRSGLMSFQLLAHCVTRVHSSCQYIHYHLLTHHRNMLSFIGKINPAQHHFYCLWLLNIHNSVLRFCCLLSGSSGLSIECCKAKRIFSLSFWIIAEGYVTNTFVWYWNVCHVIFTNDHTFCKFWSLKTITKSKKLKLGYEQTTLTLRNS